MPHAGCFLVEKSKGHIGELPGEFSETTDSELMKSDKHKLDAKKQQAFVVVVVVVAVVVVSVVSVLLFAHQG